MEITGYIIHENNKYTFHYKDDFLTLIITNQEKDADRGIYLFERREKVKYLNGWTSDGFTISFYIDGYVNKWNGRIRCFPKIVIFSKKQKFDLFKNKVKSIKFIGGATNRFYSNKNIFESDGFNILENQLIKFKSLEDASIGENVIIDKKSAFFQMSIMYPCWKYDGSITLGDISSVIRLIYRKEYKYEDLLQSVFGINDLMFFCMNRRIVKFDKICLEIRNSNDKFVEVAKIYIPTEKEKELPKNMINYMSLEGKISKLLKCLNQVGYITYKIPKDEKDLVNISATSYSNTFSAFESIYNYVHTTQGIVIDDKAFEDVKIEICNALLEIENKYKGKDGKRRKYVKSYSNIVKRSNLKLEQKIINIIKEYEFVIDTLPDQSYKDVMFSYEDAVIEAVGDRDLITHDDVFAPSNVDIAVYLIIERVCYAMILRKIGIGKKKIKDIISELSLKRII